MNKEQVLQLTPGTILHTTYPTWPACGDKHSNRWKVNGKPQTWKRDPNRWRVPIKFGQYGYDEINKDNAQFFHLESECSG